MPIYEYQCESCEQRTEAIQRIDEPPLALCPHCGGPLVKLMSAPSFQFKGTGWYVTDYAGKGGGREASGSKTKSDSSSSSSSESKGDTAKAAKAPDSTSSGTGSTSAT